MSTITRVFAVMFILCMTFTAQAQIELGVIGGFNGTSVDFDPGNKLNTNTRLDFGGGAVANFPIEGTFSIHAQAMYLRKGTNYRKEGVPGEIEAVIGAIEVPVFARFTFDAGNVHPYIMAGPSVAFNMSADQTADFIASADEDISDDLKSIDVSWGAGLGLAFPVGDGGTKIFLQGTFLQGVTDLKEDDSDFDDSIYTRGVQLMAGVTFPLGGGGGGDMDDMGDEE
ncbi:PorT family protein [Aureitalea sp. L0-47]|uniref:porin family protein n=1 Tax=Aureitalea sp. L0-47 TaxID=2816962 RepID=UPI0022389972|nr:porin family protein [Aureitalea sp. L0-47]MCW5520453.1 PorT family protein [Aureitalea sp. L0-47]